MLPSTVYTGDELTGIPHGDVIESEYEWLGVTLDARDTQLGSRIVVCARPLYVSAKMFEPLCRCYRPYVVTTGFNRSFKACVFQHCSCM